MYLNFNFLGRTISFKIVRNKVFNISFLIVKKPDKEVTGITSRCFGGKHVIFLDFDGLALEEVIEELEVLIHEYTLSNFYLFENDMENSFHAICLDKFRLWEALEIIACTSADKGFKKAPILFRQRRWVLRVTPKGDRYKPKFLDTVKSPFKEYTISTAHRLFLNENYNCKIKKRKNEDGINDVVETCDYNTGANTEKNEKSLYPHGKPILYDPEE